LSGKHHLTMLRHSKS